MSSIKLIRQRVITGGPKRRESLGAPLMFPIPRWQRPERARRLSYVPETASHWLAALSEVTEVTSYKRLSYELLGLRPGCHALDIGCGVGDDARAIAGLVTPGGKVTGVDIDAGMIEMARARQREAPGGAAAVRFLRAEGDDLPFADASFHAARMDRVLQHIPSPEAVLREVRRVVRPGGRVVVVEPDWKTMSVYPGNVMGEDGDDIAARVFQWQVENIRHPLIGRRLRALFVDGGFEQVEVRPVAYASYRFEVADLVLELGAIAERLSSGASPVLSAAQSGAWLRALREADRTGRFFSSVCLFFATARVPAMV